MKNFLLILIPFLICCADRKSDSMAKPATQKEIAPPAAESFIKRDTFMLESKSRMVDKIYIDLLKKEADKDNNTTAFYNIFFYKSDRLVCNYPVKITYGSEEGDWGLYEDYIADAENKLADSRFIHLSNGVPACGYGHDNFLFFLNGNKIQLAEKWVSVFDGGYGSDKDFFPTFSNGKATSITTRDYEIGAAENSNDSTEILEITYMDSARYRFEDSKWKKTLLTPAGKIYRKEQKNFDDFYKKL